MINYKLINKAIFFPKQGILAFGDLHLGYEQMLKEQGYFADFNQLKQSIDDVLKIFEELNKENLKVKKIIILGDLKHYFKFQKQEKFIIRDFLDSLENYVNEKDIILIKGNHEKVQVTSKKYHDYYIERDIAFVHGDRSFPEILDKKIKTIVMGHIHNAVDLKDNQGIKKEKYKCYLIGKWKNKQVIILPSFFTIKEGMDVNIDKYHDKKDFMIISKKELQNFKVHILGKDKIYDFGKLKNL